MSLNWSASLIYTFAILGRRSWDTVSAQRTQAIVKFRFTSRKANFPMTSISNGNVVKTDPHFVEETVLKNSVWIDLFPNVIDGPSHFIIEAFDWICSWIFQPYYSWVRRLTSSLSCYFFTLHKNVGYFFLLYSCYNNISSVFLRTFNRFNRILIMTTFKSLVYYKRMYLHTYRRVWSAKEAMINYSGKEYAKRWTSWILRCWFSVKFEKVIIYLLGC